MARPRARVSDAGRTAAAPTAALEEELWAAGHDLVVGVDEVGRGAWAGPLTVAAAAVPRGGGISGVRDSKALAEARREALYEELREWCVAWSVGHVSAAECDALGMSAAQRLAARRALEALGRPADHVLCDGTWDFVDGGATMVPKGDATCLSIAAASVLAKVTRDRLMRAQAECYPGFDFERNKGYPSPRHRVALHGRGPTAIHRRSWAFMDALPWPGLAASPPQPSLFA